MRHRHSVKRLATPTVKPRVKKLVNVTGAMRVVGVVVNRKLWGFGVHWDGGLHRTRPCNEHPKLCAGCNNGLPRKEKWILEVWQPANKQSVFVELTPFAADNLLADSEGSSLRGLSVIVARARPTSKAPLRVEIVSVCEFPEQLPPETDPIKTLNRIWGLD